MKFTSLKTVAILLFLFTTGFYLSGCKKNIIDMSTTDDVNIVGYLDRYPDSFSLFKEILVITKSDAYLNAYGAYTCFAVTNSGVNDWLKKIGAPTVNAVDVNTLKELVKFHLIEDTISTSEFTDGKMPVPTMYGEYLITGVGQQEEGTSSFIINRQAFVLQSNVKVGNGIIHVINHMLIPADKTLAQRLEADPNYSIFLEAVKKTGFYDLLNTVNTEDSTKRWITLIAESNAALADSGIFSFADLKAKYSATGTDFTSLDDTLNLYVRYHIVPGLKFLADVILSQSESTLAPQEILTVKKVGLDIYLNDDEFNGVHEQGILLVRDSSDRKSTNGVLHSAVSHFNIKYRRPFAVYWDVCDIDFIRKLTQYYQKSTIGLTAKTSQDDYPIDGIDWNYLSGWTWAPTYAYSSTENTCNRDYLELPCGGPNRPGWWELTTPLLVKGKYKVWMCYRQAQQSKSSNNLCTVSIDGVAMQRPFNFTEKRPDGNDGDLESIYYKRYAASTTSNLYVGRMVGIIDITTTDKHKLRIDNVTGTQNRNWLDMVHFIPIDEDQILPRFDKDGNKVWE